MFQPISYQPAFGIMWGLVICPFPAMLLMSANSEQA
jgi:hypothetical protein